jgi:hypothetical protein
MWKPRFPSILLAAFLLVPLPRLSAETDLGSIVSLSGGVSIDAFGKGAFLPARNGDVLYQGTVVRTAADGKAVLLLQGIQSEVPPAAFVKVADLVKARSRSGGLAWLQSVGKALKSFTEAGKRQEQQVVLGSRAAEAEKPGADLEWMDEDESAEKLLKEAKRKASSMDYAGALTILAEAGEPVDVALAADILFWKGCLYYQTEDYADAERCLSDAYGRISSTPAAEASPKDSRAHRVLLFQLGASRFFLGMDKQAAEVLQVLLWEGASEEFEPYSYMFALKALLSSGDKAQARALFEKGKPRLSGTALEKDFAALASEL